MKGGVLRHGRTDTRRVGIVAVATAAMIATPLALLSSGGASLAQAASSNASSVRFNVLPSAAATARAQVLRNIQIVEDHIAAPTTTTTAPPSPPTTVVPVVTTTTAPHVYLPPPTTITTAPAPMNSSTGEGTWYLWHTGQCASPTLPHGTVVTVTNNNDGKSTTCLITDTEASGWPRILDMDPSVFDQIADTGSTSEGVLNSITVSW